jgi:hypothetical protein
MIKWIATTLLVLVALAQGKVWEYNYVPRCEVLTGALSTDIVLTSGATAPAAQWTKPRLRIYYGSPPSGYSDTGQTPLVWRYWPAIQYPVSGLGEGPERARYYLSYFRFINLDDQLVFVPASDGNPVYNQSSATVVYGDNYLDLSSDFFFPTKRWRVEWIRPPLSIDLDFGMLPSNFVSEERGEVYTGQRGSWYGVMTTRANLVCETAPGLLQTPFLLTHSFYYTPATSPKRRMILDFNRPVFKCAGGGRLPEGSATLSYVSSVQPIKATPGTGEYVCLGCTGTSGTTWSIENGVNAATDCLDPSTTATTRYLPRAQRVVFGSVPFQSPICDSFQGVFLELDQTDATQGVGDGIDAAGRAFLVSADILSSTRRIGAFFDRNGARLAHLVHNLPVPVDDSATVQTWLNVGYHTNDNFVSIVEMPAQGNWTSLISSSGLLLPRVFTTRGLGGSTLFSSGMSVRPSYAFFPASIASISPEIAQIGGAFRVLYRVTTTTFFPSGNVFRFFAQSAQSTSLAYTCQGCDSAQYQSYRYIVPVTPISSVALSMCIEFDPLVMMGSFVGGSVCSGNGSLVSFGVSGAAFVSYSTVRIYLNNVYPLNVPSPNSLSADVTASCSAAGQPNSIQSQVTVSGPSSIDVVFNRACAFFCADFSNQAACVYSIATSYSYIDKIVSIRMYSVLASVGEVFSGYSGVPIDIGFAQPVVTELPLCAVLKLSASRYDAQIRFSKPVQVVDSGLASVFGSSSLFCANSNSASCAYVSPTGTIIIPLRTLHGIELSLGRILTNGEQIEPYQIIFEDGSIHLGLPYRTLSCPVYIRPVIDRARCDGDFVFVYSSSAGAIFVANGTNIPFVCGPQTFNGQVYSNDVVGITILVPDGARSLSCVMRIPYETIFEQNLISELSLVVCDGRVYAPLQAVLYPTRLFVEFSVISGFIPSSVDNSKWLFNCSNISTPIEYREISDNFVWMEFGIPSSCVLAENQTATLQLLTGAFSTLYEGQVNTTAVIQAIYSEEVLSYPSCVSGPGRLSTTMFNISGTWRFVSSVDREPCNRQQMLVSEGAITFVIDVAPYTPCGTTVTLSGVGDREFTLELVYGSCDRLPLKYDTIYRYTPALNYDISKSLSYYEEDVTYVTDDSNSGFGPLEWKKEIVSYNRYSIGLNFTGQFDCTYFFGPSVATAISKGTADRVMDIWFNPSNEVLQYSIQVWARPDLRAGDNWLLAFSSEILASTNGGGSSGCSGAKYSSGVWARSVGSGAQIIPLLGSNRNGVQISCSDSEYGSVYSTNGFYTQGQIPDIEHAGAYPYLPGSTTTEVFQGVLTVYAQKVEPPGPYYSSYYNYTIRYVYWSKSGRKEFLSSGIAGTQDVCQESNPYCVTKGQTYEYIPFKSSASRMILAPVYTPGLDPSERSKWCPDVLPSFHPAFRPYQYSPQMFTGQLYQTAMYGRALSDAEIDDLWQTGLPNSRPAVRATFIRILEDTSANLNVSLDLYDFDIMELGRTDQTLTVLSLTLKSGRGSLVSNVSNDTVFFVPEFCTFGENYAEVEVKLFDGIDVSREWVVPIHVTHVNHAPISANISAKVILDQNSTVTVDGVDCDQGDSVVATVLLEPPTEGTVYHPVTRLPIAAYPVQFPGGTFYYLPATGQVVPDQYDTIAYAFIPFLVTDSQGLNSTAPAWIQLNISNNVQAGTPPVLKVPEDTLVSFDITSGFDAQGYPVRYKIMTLPVNGTLYQDAVPIEFALLPFAVTGQLQYQGLADFYGPDSFTFIAESTNTSRQSSRGTVHISITPFNDPPSIGEPIGAKFGYTLAPAALRAQVTLDLFDVDSEENAYDIDISCSRGVQLELSEEAKWLYGNWSAVDPGRNNVRRGDYLSGNPRFTASFSKPVLGGLLRNFTLECGTVEKHEIQFTLTDNTGLSDRKSATRTLEFDCLDGTALFGSTTGSSLLGTVVLLSWIALALLLGGLICGICVWPELKKCYLKPQLTKVKGVTSWLAGRRSWRSFLPGGTKARHEQQEDMEMEQALLY